MGVSWDLHQSILIMQKAMPLIPSDHPSWHPRLLGILGTSILVCYQKRGELPDLAKLISVHGSACSSLSRRIVGWLPGQNTLHRSRRVTL